LLLIRWSTHIRSSLNGLDFWFTYLYSELQEIEGPWGPWGAGGADETATSFLDGEPSLQELLDWPKSQICKTDDNRKWCWLVENDVNFQEMVPDTAQGSWHLTLKLHSVWSGVKNLNRRRNSINGYPDPLSIIGCVLRWWWSGQGSWCAGKCFLFS
jgi:hypothetical protein